MSGHPEANQYEEYAKNLKFHDSDRLAPDGERKVALVDIDETICFYPDKRRYDLAEPHEENVAKINKLHGEGWYIIYWTARGSRSGIDYEEFTRNQLLEWGCKYHNLICGKKKPHFDMVIDDKSKRIEEL